MDLTVTRHDHDTHGEYHATIPGIDAIGRLSWVARGPVRVAEHTLVPPELGGRGVAGKLVEALIEDARTQGFRVQPDCPFVAAAFKRHPEWADLLA